MATTECDACGERVSVSGGISGLFDTDPEPTGGMTLGLADGSEHFLCFDCIERLPDDREVTEADVEAL